MTSLERPGVERPPDAGLRAVRVGALLRVRMASERLPGKALADIAGRPALAHQLDRLYASRYLSPADVVVCTTTDPEDDALVPAVERMGATLFRGSSEDIIDRFAHAVARYPFDVVIQVDGDDVCVEPQYMDLCVERLLADETLDLVMCEGLPLGAASKAVRRQAIERVHSQYVPGPNATAAMLYFTQTGLCTTASVDPVSARHIHDRARLTLDYPEDLAFFRALFDRLYVPGTSFTLDAIVELLREEPELVEINAFLTDAYFQRSDDLVAAERLRVRTADGVRALDFSAGGRSASP